MSINKVNVKSKFKKINEYWTPHIVGELNNHHVKIAKLKGEFVWHKHDREDEMFLVQEGTLFIELRDQVLELQEGEFVIIPKGVEHKPYAPKEVKVLLFEPKTTLNTGDVDGDMTVKNLKRI